MNHFTTSVLTVFVYVFAMVTLQTLILRRVDSQDYPQEERVKRASSERTKGLIRKAAAMSCMVVMSGMSIFLSDDPSPTSTQVVGDWFAPFIVGVGMLVFFGPLFASLKSKQFFKLFS